MDFWDQVLRAEPTGGEARVHIRQLAIAADRRRTDADYDTGSINEDEAYRLLALAAYLPARVILEVGTFIGMSTTALATPPTVEALYTCDVSNDCFRVGPDDTIHPFPRRTSTHMLTMLHRRGNIAADLCFFDGVLNDADVALLASLTTPATVFAFHDYDYGPKLRRTRGHLTTEIVPRKGIGNVRLLHPRLPGYRLIEPPAGTTLALLVPGPVQ